MTDTGNPGYAEALTELDAILRELESSDVDVDRLADRVARAAELISLCRDRISAARLRIDDVRQRRHRQSHPFPRRHQIGRAQPGARDRTVDRPDPQPRPGRDEREQPGQPRLPGRGDPVVAVRHEQRMRTRCFEERVLRLPRPDQPHPVSAP